MKELKEEIRLKMATSKSEEEYSTLSLLAVSHNMILLLEDKRWERLPKKLWALRDAHDSLIDALNKRKK